jgi:type I restriction enzyme S subunit
MKKWKSIQLKDVAIRITKGTTPTTLGFSFVEEGINFIKAESINRYGEIDESTFAKIDQKTHECLKRSQIAANDILLTIAGVYLGKVGLVKTSHLPANTNQAVAIVRIDSRQASPEFLKYFFLNKSTTTYLNMLCPQSAQPNLNLTQLGRIQITLPELAEQKKIASILSAYDDLIENNKRRIAILEKMAEEIYREWFVKMRFPASAKTTAGKPADSKKSGALLPEKWRYRPLGELCLVIKRGVSPSYDDTAEGVVINQKCIRNQKLNLEFAQNHNTRVPEEKYLKHADVLINSTGVGTLGRVAPVDFIPAGLTVDSHVTICRADEEQIDPYYLAHTIMNLQSYFEYIATGSTGQVELGRTIIASTKIVVPEPEMQKRFADIVAPIWKLKHNLSIANCNLAKIRDLLLPRLISGKLSVENLDLPSNESASTISSALPQAELAHA